MKRVRTIATSTIAILALLQVAAGPWRDAHAATRSPRGPCEMYFAEGTTRQGYDEYLCLGNPGVSTVTVRVECVLDEGAPVSSTVEVPARSRVTLSATDLVGRGWDVSLHLSADSPFVAERPIYFDTGGAAGSTCAEGAAAPSERWYFAEGSTGPGFREYLCLFNPGSDDSRLEIKFATADGGGKAITVSVPGRSRRTVDVRSEVGPGFEVAAEVRAANGVPVVAERPMYFAGEELRGGHCAAGIPMPLERFDFAEGTTRDGFREYLCLYNPGGAAIEVTADLMLEDGTARQLEVAVPARSRRTIDVNAAVGPGRDVSARLSSGSAFCAERPVYFTAFGVTDGHCAQGSGTASRRWAFAEGTTRAGFRPFFCIENPQARHVHVDIDFLSGGSVTPVEIEVGAKSRATVDPLDYLDFEGDFSSVVRAERPVVAESVQYGAAPGGYGGGHCAVGDSAWERTRFGDVRTYLNTYGEYKESDIDTFKRYDVAVLDPADYPDPSFVSRLRSAGTIVLAYVDIGEAEEYRPYWSEVRKHPEVLLGRNPDWPGSWYADANNPEWHHIILEHAIPYLQSLGELDGLCLDMLDMVDVYPRQKPGMVDLVRKIREWYPELLLMPNRGFGVLRGVWPYIDAFKYEEMSSRYDSDRKDYVLGEDDEELAALESALGSMDIPVFVLDHVSTDPPDNGMARDDFDRCARIADETGRRFIWYANSIEQDHPAWTWLPLR